MEIEQSLFLQMNKAIQVLNNLVFELGEAYKNTYCYNQTLIQKVRDLENLRELTDGND